MVPFFSWYSAFCISPFAKRFQMEKRPASAEDGANYVLCLLPPGKALLKATTANAAAFPCVA
jgi:hypothetical protein